MMEAETKEVPVPERSGHLRKRVVWNDRSLE